MCGPASAPIFCMIFGFVSGHLVGTVFGTVFGHLITGHEVFTAHVLMILVMAVRAVQYGFIIIAIFVGILFVGPFIILVPFAAMAPFAAMVPDIKFIVKAAAMPM